MKRLILGMCVFAMSYCLLVSHESMSQTMCEENCEEEPEYWTLAQIGPDTYCCVGSANELDTCSGIPCP